MYGDTTFFRSIKVVLKDFKLTKQLLKSVLTFLTQYSLDRNDVCFGNFLSRFLLEHLFGYDDILMSSFKKVAANVSNKGNFHLINLGTI